MVVSQLGAIGTASGNVVVVLLFCVLALLSWLNRCWMHDVAAAAVVGAPQNRVLCSDPHSCRVWRFSHFSVAWKQLWVEKSMAAVGVVFRERHVWASDVTA